MEGFSDRFIDDVCVLFGAWAVSAQIVVFAGGTLYHLVAAFLLVLPALVAVWRHVRDSSPGPVAAVSRSVPYAGGALVTAAEAGAVVLAVLACLALFSARPIAFWWLATAATGLGAATMIGTSRARLASVRIGRRHELLLCGLALTLGLVAIFAHRFNFDDSHYIHLAVAAIDRPDVPLLSEDTVHGLYGVPHRLPAHKVRAFELFNGAVALATGLPPIRVFHLVSAFLAALLVPLAWARLFRLLAPRYWLAAVAVVIAIYLGVGETNYWYSNFGVVRIWQGKSIFLSVFLPLVYAFGIEFAVNPSRRRALLLFAAQSASIGVSSSALWGAPLAAGLGLLTGVGRPRRALWILPAGMLTSGFVFATAISVRGDLARMSRGLQTAMVLDPGAMLSDALHLVLGDGRLLGFSIVVLGCGWVVSGRGTLARRFAVVVPFVGLLVMLNPYAISWVRGNATGPAYWRALWGLPLPALIALVLVSPLGRHRGSEVDRSRRWQLTFASIDEAAIRQLAALCLSIAFLLWIPARSAIGADNLVEWRLPGLKVDAEGYALAERVNDSVPEGAFVVAPTIASRWIPTFSHHAYPLHVRDYLTLPLAEQDKRGRIVEFADGTVRSEERRIQFEKALAEYTIRAVCLRTEGQMAPIYRILMARGFRRSYSSHDWEIWVR